MAESQGVAKQALEKFMHACPVVPCTVHTLT